MGAVSSPGDIGISAITSAGVGSWADPSGIRGVVRHGLGRQAAIILLGASLVGAISGIGNPLVFAVLALVAVGQFVAGPVLRRFGHSLPPETDFRIALVGWPIALAVLSATGWTTHLDLIAVVAVAGFVMAALVALAESTMVAAAWASVAAIAMWIGAVAANHASVETAIAAGSIAGGTLTGVRLRTSIEGFLGARRQLMRDVARVPVSDDPFVTAELLLRPLAHWTPLKNPSIIWFTADRRGVFLAVAGDDLPPSLQGGRELPAARYAVLRPQAESGPWINGWTIRNDDYGYSRQVAALGISAVAYAPMLFEGRLIGLVSAGLADRGDDRSSMAEYVPTLVQFADAVAVELGPTLAAWEQTSTARLRIDDILQREAFWPVFQPVRRLADGRIVGYEALSRFNGQVGPSDTFLQARLSGRLRELEVATIRAVATSSARMPSDCWLSINVSPELLIDADVLADLLAPIRQDIVIELSEHEAITDYAPIADGLRRLGPRRQLAVDDAGAGFASLRHILEVRPHLVKLDIGLVQGVASDLTRTALIAGFARFAADAGFELIAEGIETEEDRRALHRLGVSLGQGYLLGMPERLESLATDRIDPARGSEPERRVRSRRDKRTSDKPTPAARAG
ncbi:MAG TPA: EAL domain-containing protein [Candidatus Dormibacteraeota bacterium]|nr:EAL domain-containing protein [Candidatus Dormibacteraeota bacterium]